MMEIKRSFYSAVLGGVVLNGGFALGQEHYTLTDEDTWSQSEAADPGTPEGQLGTIRATLADNRFERAAHLATGWIERHEHHPLAPEAYLLRGDALRSGKDYYEALFDYEYVARTFTGSEAFPRALEREFEIAVMFANGVKRKLWGMRLVDASDDAEELLIRIQVRLPGSRLAEQAGITLGDFYYRRGAMPLATEAYTIFLENHPDSEFADRAKKQLIYAHLASFKGPEFDPSGLEEARALLRDLQQTDPLLAQKFGADALIHRIDDSGAAKLLKTALWYERTEDVIAAEYTLRRLLRRYPHSVSAGKAPKILPRMFSRLPTHIIKEARAAQVYPPEIFTSRDEPES